MAIQIDLSTSNFGVPFAGAYFRIVTATCSRTRDPLNKYSVMIDVVGYAAAPTNEDTKEVDFRRYHVPYTEVSAMTGENIFEKCYGWVMAQPDMAGSIAV